MKSIDLLELLGEVPDRYIRDARKKSGPRRWLPAVAACLCIAVIGLLLPRLGGNAPADNTGSGEGFMSYAGPVLPLTLDDADGLTAVRDLTYDLTSPYREAMALDRYILTNPTDTDRTARAAYPMTGNLQELRLPSVQVNGEDMPWQLYTGPYTGGFRGAGAEAGDLNLDPPDEWADYTALLADDSYRQAALGEVDTTMLDCPVIVYRLGQFQYSAQKADNPSLQMAFHLDYDRTQVLTYGMDGGTIDLETGYGARCAGAIEARRAPGDIYVLVLGDDLIDYTVAGFANGGCTDPLDDLTCTVTRYESTLGEMLRQLSRKCYDDMTYERPPLDFELYYREICRFMADYSLVGERPVGRYDMGILEDILSEVRHHDRVFYAVFELTVPAGGSVEVAVERQVMASYHYPGTGREDQLYFDAASVLGSDLTFTEQTLTVTGVDWNRWNVADCNFGWSAEVNTRTLTLDPDIDHYWLTLDEKK